MTTITKSCAYISEGVFSHPGRLTEIKNVAEFGRDRFYDIGMVARGCWKVIHTLADSGEYTALCVLLQTFSKRFVCTRCRVHINEYIKKHISSLHSSVKDGDTRGVLKWTIDFHNCVNARLGKPLFTNSAIKITYPGYDWEILPEQPKQHKKRNTTVGYIGRGLYVEPEYTTKCSIKCPSSSWTNVPDEKGDSSGIWYCIYLLIACSEFNAARNVCKSFGYKVGSCFRDSSARGALSALMTQNNDNRDPARLFYELTTGADIDGTRKRYLSL